MDYFDYDPATTATDITVRRRDAFGYDPDLDYAGRPLGTPRKRDMIDVDIIYDDRVTDSDKNMVDEGLKIYRWIIKRRRRTIKAQRK